MNQAHMRKTQRIIFLFAISSLLSIATAKADKSIYKPSSFGAMDLNNNSSKWCYDRSIESDNFIVFWESAYGTNPKTTSSSTYRVNVDALLNIAEKSFTFYRDSLKFVIEGSSKTDSYKMIILLYYSTTWQASGSGVDDQIGLLSLSANAAQALGVTVAHEVGHCFQYQVHADGHPGGWMYGYGNNGSGGNGWWEQCAQWQAFKVLPEQQFTNYNFSNYLKTTYKHILHETPRYANYFIQDYWTYLHGIEFIGKLWQQSKYPEDPIVAYKRLTKISQTDFNDEIYDCASRFVTWDIPALEAYGKNYTDAHKSSSMTATANDFWLIDPSNCIENYGYNVIRLNAPEKDSMVTVLFEGKAGAAGFRSYNQNYAGWRYGLVGLKDDGTREYSSMRSPTYDGASASSPIDTLTFLCTEKYSRLWLVVTGAPRGHWRHAWDDDDSNDEQWPYQVKFKNTNLYGIYSFEPEDEPENKTLNYNLTLKPFTGNANPYPSTVVQPNWEGVCHAFLLQLSEIKSAYGSAIKYCAINPNASLNYNSTANAPGHWFSRSGATTNWGNGSYIFSEFNTSNFTFNIGQYPNVCKIGDQFTIRQGLVYTPPTGKQVTVTLVFNITIANETSTDLHTPEIKAQKSLILNTIVMDVLYLKEQSKDILIYDLNGKLIKSVSDVSEVDLGDLHAGIYLASINGVTTKIIKVTR